MIDPISSAALGASLGSFLSHLLSKDTSKGQRLRHAKIVIRGFIQRVEDAHPGYLFEVHEALSDDLKMLGNAVIDDLTASKQEEFGRACASFINTTEAERTPKVTPSPFHRPRTPEEKAIEKENWVKPTELLKSRLITVLNCL